MKVLFLAVSRLSLGDAVVAADVARSLPRSRFQVGFAAAQEAVPHLHDLGMPTLPLAGSTPADNLAVLDGIVRGFQPDCLVAADAFAVQESQPWSGLTIETLRERYDRPVASFDRIGWQAAGYSADSYGGGRIELPRLLDGCDVLIRTSPPHPPEPGPSESGPAKAGRPGVVAAALRFGGLRDGGLRTSDAREAPRSQDEGRPLVFLVNSPWEYRNPGRSVLVAQLVDALPRLVHSHLAALGRPLRVVHVGPRQWRFPPAEQIEYRHYSRLPYQTFHEQLTAADLFLTTNVLSATLAQAVLAAVPSVVLRSHQEMGPGRIPDWAATAAPLLRGAYPFHVAPLGWHDLMEPLLAGNPYQDCFAAAELFDRSAVLHALTGLLDDPAARTALRQRQRDYHDRLATLPAVGEALRAAVAR